MTTPNRVSIRGLTQTQLSNTVGFARELIVDITNWVLTVHDNSTPGGIRIAKEDLSNAPDATNSQDGKATKELVSTVEANTAAIGVNAGNINQNATDIAANTTAIGNNATAIGATDAALNTHITDQANPHNTTKESVGLANVTNDAQLKIASNLADLNSAKTARTNIGLPDAAQGSLRTYNAAGSPVTLAPGPIGEVLTSGGPGEDLVWQPASKAPTRQIFTASGIWNRPLGCVAVLVKVQGPGGSGGGSGNGNDNQGGGGSAGGYCESLLDVTAIASSTITVGTGGAAPGSASNGNPGSGPSVWSDGINELIANEGIGGIVGSTGTTTRLGGTAIGGEINIQGQQGGLNEKHSVSMRTGYGGDSMLGHGGLPMFNNNGNPATGYGSGGAGGHRDTISRIGSAGQDGIVIIEEYY